MEGTPVDSVVLSLFQLQVFYYNEVKCGLAGVGEYTLLPEFSIFMSIVWNTVKKNVQKEIVQAIKDGKDVVPMKEEVINPVALTLLTTTTPVMNPT